MYKVISIRDRNMIHHKTAFSLIRKVQKKHDVFDRLRCSDRETSRCNYRRQSKQDIATTGWTEKELMKMRAELCNEIPTVYWQMISTKSVYLFASDRTLVSEELKRQRRYSASKHKCNRMLLWQLFY